VYGALIDSGPLCGDAGRGLPPLARTPSSRLAAQPAFNFAGIAQDRYAKIPPAEARFPVRRGCPPRGINSLGETDLHLQKTVDIYDNMVLYYGLRT